MIIFPINRGQSNYADLLLNSHVNVSLEITFPAVVIVLRNSCALLFICFSMFTHLKINVSATHQKIPSILNSFRVSHIGACLFCMQFGIACHAHWHRYWVSKCNVFTGVF